MTSPDHPLSTASASKEFLASVACRRILKLRSSVTIAYFVTHI